ncbi:MAG: gliding motility-associated C-terminal domain-containing protein [Elusimicrobiota bacterium]|nr:gliding motility-associated C-terminal domain-containing protein [Elusimicrobiota bacterium]
MLFALEFNCSVSIGNIIKSIHIEHIPINTIYGLNSNITFTIDIMSDIDIKKATIFYKYSEEAEFKSRDFDDLNKLEETTINAYKGNVIITDSELNKIGDFEYYIEVEDETGLKHIWNLKNASNPQKVAIISDLGEIIITPEGGVYPLYGTNGNILLSLNVPSDAVSTPTKVTITQKELSSDKYFNGNNPAVAYEFLPSLEFKKPIIMDFRYLDANNDNKVDNLDREVDSADNLRAYLLEGDKWELIGGKIDKLEKNVSFKTTHLSVYALFYTKLDKAAYRPKYRIFTPNGDGINDKILFNNLDNEKLTLKFFDINGRKVRELKEAPYEWNGRDASGRLVESGLYIYQFKVKIDEKDQYVNGTVALAK